MTLLIVSILATCSLFQAVKSNKIFVLTNCGASGAYGPTSNQCETEYSEKSVSFLDVTKVEDGLQIITIKEEGYYEIEAIGARGGFNSQGVAAGYGAIVKSIFKLSAGEELNVIVGQAGSDGWKGAGGGATWIYHSSTPLLVAGGGGGMLYKQSSQNLSNIVDGQATTDGGPAVLFPGRATNGEAGPIGPIGRTGMSGNVGVGQPISGTGWFKPNNASLATICGPESKCGLYFVGGVDVAKWNTTRNSTGGFGGGGYGNSDSGGGGGGYSGGAGQVTNYGDHPTSIGTGGGSYIGGLWPSYRKQTSFPKLDHGAHDSCDYYLWENGRIRTHLTTM
eukprot:m.104179 g.104179  ORF g.104179 m.104179 type:complete len:335 (+) comp13837_c0_seq3:96-1100(+)